MSYIIVICTYNLHTTYLIFLLILYPLNLPREAKALTESQPENAWNPSRAVHKLSPIV